MSFWKKLGVKWKLTIIVLLLVFIPIAGVFFSGTQFLNDGFMQEHRRDGEKIVSFVNNLIETFEQDLRRSVTLLQQNELVLTAMYFAVEAEAKEELQDIVHSLLTTLAVHEIEVRDLRGALVARDQTTPDAFELHLSEETVQMVLAGTPVLETISTGAQMAVSVTAPLAYQGDLLGMITAAIVIDDAFAERISVITGEEVAILKEDAPVASSSEAFRDACLQVLSGAQNLGPHSTRLFSNINVKDKEYTLVVEPFTATAGEADCLMIVGLDSTELAAIQQQSRSAVLKFSAIFLICAVALVLWMTSIAVRPLVHMTEVARAIAKGDTQQAIPESRSLDEIGALNRAFQTVVNYLQDMTQVARSIATGDLQQEVRPKSDRDLLGQAFQQMIDYLNQMAAVATAIAEGDLCQEVQPRTEHDALGNAFQHMQALRTAMTRIMGGTQQLRDASESLTQISAHLASGIENTSRQTQVVSSNSHQISLNMNGVSTATEELDASSRELARNVREVTDLISSAVEATNAANTTIQTLENRSQEIGSIINVITTVTDQTNLLALNATIEAARAGEVGKGFAVVAKEIKELARETATSAGDIIRRVEAIQTSTLEATERIGHVSKITRQVHELSLETAIAIEQQSATIGEVSRSISETADGSDEITHTISEVARVTQQNAEQTTNVQNAAQELATLAEQLQQLIGKFKI